MKLAPNNASLLDLTVTNYEVISGDLSLRQSSASFHNLGKPILHEKEIVTISRTNLPLSIKPTLIAPDLMI
jgi:hypothetical protein